MNISLVVRIRRQTTLNHVVRSLDDPDSEPKPAQLKMSKTIPRNDAAIGVAPDAQPKTYQDFPFVRELHEALSALQAGGFWGMILAGVILAEVPGTFFESVSDLLRRFVPGKWTGYGAWIDYAPVLIPYVVLLVLTLRHLWNRCHGRGTKGISVWVALIFLCVIPSKRLLEVRTRADESTEAKNGFAKQINDAVQDGISIRDKVLAARIDELSRQVDILKDANRVQGPQRQSRP